jgi:two-component system cell cycle response regulator
VGVAASVHDVGRLGLPETLLTKSGPLNPEEWAVMRTHPEIGQRILESAPSLSNAAELVRSHHERYDGFGYPDRLVGDEIPLGARIITVCAAFVAIMRHRQFSDATTVAALAEIRRYSGMQFDPNVVDVFCELLMLART